MMSRRRSKGPYHLVREAMKVTTTLLKTPSETEKEHTFVLEAMKVMTTLLRTSSETGKDQQHTPRSRLRHSSPSPPPLVAPFALPLHRRIIPSSHRRILHAVPSSHRLIFASSYRRTPSTMPHRLIVPSSRLLIIPSSNTINNASSPHRLIASSTHRLTVTSPQLRIISSSHAIKNVPSPGRLVVWSCPVLCVCARGGRARMCSRACHPAQLAVADDAYLCCDGRRERGSRRPAARCLLQLNISLGLLLALLAAGSLRRAGASGTPRDQGFFYLGTAGIFISENSRAASSR